MDPIQHIAGATAPGTHWLSIARFLALGLTCVAIAAGALTNRIVIYRDWDDLAWSCAPAGFLVGGFLLATMLGGDAQTGERSPAAIAVLLLAGSGIALSLIMSLVCAIRCNGILVGLLVFAFKIAVALLVSVLVLAQVLGRRDEAGRPRAPNYLLLAAVAGAVGLLVNGERVAARRLAASHDLSHFPVLPGALR